MEIIRNLGGVQKGLLGGLVLGILVVYLCLCVSATGVVPMTPKAGKLEAGALAAVSTTAPATDSITTTAPVALPTEVVPTAAPAPTELPAPPTTAVEPTLAPTEAPSVALSAPRAEPAQVALVLEQATEPGVPSILPTATVEKPPAARKPAVALAAAKPVQVPTSPAVVSPTPEWTWRGVEYERVPGSKSGNTSAVLAVRVVGVPDRKVFVREVTGGWNTTLVTGRKPQYGDFSDDIGGIQPSTYIVKPMDIDDQVQVQINPGDYVLIEFALRPPANWTPEPTSVAQAAPAAATPAATPVPAAPAPAATEAPSTSTEAADWAWQGIEYQRLSGSQTHNVFGVLAVRVVGVPDRKVFIRENSGGWTTTLITGQKPEYGDFSDSVGGLEAGDYTIKPMDIDNQISVHLNAGDFVLVEFALRPTHPLTNDAAAAQPTATVQVAATIAPPPPAATPLPATAAPAADASPAATADWTWQGLEYQRISGAATGNSVGVLAVRVVGVPNRKVFVRETSGGWNATLVTGDKPQYGDFSDEIGGLPPGTYDIKPMDIDNDVQVTLNTGDFVLVEFALRPAKVLTDQPAQTGGAN